jgi:hypothetical protein
MLIPDALNRRSQLVVAVCPHRSLRRIPPLRLCRKYMDGASGSTAQIGSTPKISMIIDEADHHFALLSSSAWARYSDRFLRFSFAPAQFEILAFELVQARPSIRSSERDANRRRARPGGPSAGALRRRIRVSRTDRIAATGKDVLCGIQHHPDGARHPDGALTQLEVLASSGHRLQPLSERALRQNRYDSREQEFQRVCPLVDGTRLGVILTEVKGIPCESNSFDARAEQFNRHWRAAKDCG